MSFTKPRDHTRSHLNTPSSVSSRKDVPWYAIVSLWIDEAKQVLVSGSSYLFWSWEASLQQLTRRRLNATRVSPPTIFCVGYGALHKTSKRRFQKSDRRSARRSNPSQDIVRKRHHLRIHPLTRSSARSHQAASQIQPLILAPDYCMLDSYLFRNYTERGSSCGTKNEVTWSQRTGTLPC